MAVDRIKFQDIVASQLPQYVQEEYPLLPEFLKQYYKSQEYQGGSYDLIQNIDKYIKLDELHNLKDFTILGSDLDYTSKTVYTSDEGNFTEGFPDSNGIIKIDDEIISYEYKTDSTFENCKRGFSGITTHIGTNTPDELVFSSTKIDEHSKDSRIYNLNIIFLQEFFKKIKTQFAPGFTERKLYPALNQRNFVYGADSFYKSKGTDESFKILFNSLYGEKVEVLKPSQFLIRPSDADYKTSQCFVVEQINGDPLDLKNRTLYQDSTNSRGSVSNVEIVPGSDFKYYKISIDTGYKRDIDADGSIFGEFIPNPKTRVLETVSVGTTYISVDSTISFPETGNLKVDDLNGNNITLSYSGKNVNQFLNVGGVTNIIPEINDIRLDDHSYSMIGAGNSITVRITSTLKELEIEDGAHSYSTDDIIRFKALGIESEEEKTKNWKYNVRTKWNVKEIVVIDITERTYQFETFDDHFLYPGSIVSIIDDFDNVSIGNVSKISSKNIFTAKLSGLIDITGEFVVKNNILKGNSDNYPHLNDFISNVQNTYSKFNGDTLIASNSLANYNNIPTNPFSRSITFSGTSELDEKTLILTSGDDHGFYTGDAIYYKPAIFDVTTINSDGFEVISHVENKFENINENVYYVKREDSTSIKLSRSKADIFSDNYLNLVGIATNNTLTFYDFYNKPISAQGIYREIVNPVNKSGVYETNPGYTGILINGVEILNYKSSNSIYFGDIRSFEVTGGGDGYDILNPPLLKVDDRVKSGELLEGTQSAVVYGDEIGVGATGICNVIGELKEIQILDNGYDYSTKPIIKISGGNGTGALAEANLSLVINTVPFNSESRSRSTSFNSGITTSGASVYQNTIGFTTYHKFEDFESVVYRTNDSKVVSGLSTDSNYFVGLVNSTTVKLYITEDDARSGINTVSINDYGLGIHNIESYVRKKIVGNIIVTNSGSGYENKKRRITNVGVNTSLNQFNITNHGYSSGEIVEYSSLTEDIVGLSTTEQYYVHKVDENNFKLSNVGTGLTVNGIWPKNSNYIKKIHTSITKIGNGDFNYEPITVEIEGIAKNDCKIQPIFRGSIKSIDLLEGGVGYGSSEVINFNRQPQITVYSGKGALVTPIVNNGSIVDVLINKEGEEYNSPPEIFINGTGKYARLTPIINNGALIEVKVINGGVGFGTNTTSINVIAAGSGSRIDANIRNWNINLYQRNYNTITDDDGFIDQNISGNTLQYSHIYAPRKLRETTYALTGAGSDNSSYGIFDLSVEDGIEVDSKYHSPILGWAYDGNPIYGPYGYSESDGGNVNQMKSGYELNVKTTNRPSTSKYPGGFFVEDYIFTERGDLDENNGRFCITPDYPKGRYVYFSTLSTYGVDSSGPFRGYKSPAFPYFIGNIYESKPNDFNFKSTSNQVEYDIGSSNWFRNTKIYHTNDSQSGYDYIINSNNNKDQIVTVKGISVGNIDSVGIFTGGDNYKVKDNVVFDNTGSSGYNAQAKVDRVYGETIDTITTESTVFNSIEFTNDFNRSSFIGFNAIPHGLENNDIININSISSPVEGFGGTYNIGIRSDNFVLSLGIGTTGVTGIATYFYVSGALDYPNIRENDILTIDNEKIKVLNIDNKTSRIRVLREQYGTVGSSHTSSSILWENPRKFRVNVGTLTTTKTFRSSKEFYFNPSESVGLGTTSVTNTLGISNPGVGLTQIDVKDRSIYIPSHGLKLNDVLYYHRNGGNSINTWSPVTGNPYKELSEYSKLYVAPLTNNTIGIATNKIGFTTNGYYGVNNEPGILYFVSNGTDVYHSFKTSFEDTITARVDRNIVTVSVAETHSMKKNENIFMNVIPTDNNTITVKYDDYNRRIVFNPINFIASNIDVDYNTITINSHDFVTGDKVVHTSTSPCGGLVNNDMYYVIYYNRHKIRLVKENYEVKQPDPKVVNITSGSIGTLSKINPLINNKRGSNLVFDLSDSSLSFNYNGSLVSSFIMRFYTDYDHDNLYLTSNKTRVFDVSYNGKVGIDSDANVTIVINDSTPDSLFYKFDLDNIDIIPDIKKEIIIDKTVESNNKINIVSTVYDGKHVISGIGSTTFSFNLSKIPDNIEYNKLNSDSTYQTDSENASGPISRIKIFDKGYQYQSLPGITTITSDKGSGALVEAYSTNIGKIISSKMDNVGFDYPTDNTLRPTANLPEILEIESLSTFKRIGISSAGLNYLKSPTLVVIDGYSNKVVEDLDIRYELGDTEVTIFKNSTGMFNTPPRIIPTINSNGVGISSLTYQSSTQTVRLYINGIFTNEDEDIFPFVVGDNVFVEGLNVGIASTGTGYNSSNYDYRLFNVTNSSLSVGGARPYIEYSMEDFVPKNIHPGNVDLSKSLGRVIRENELAIFDSDLVTKKFHKDEMVSNDGNIGFVESWDKKNNFLKVSTSKEFEVGTIVKGVGSNTQGLIKDKINFQSSFITGAGASMTDGWRTNVGFLDDNLQKIPNNEYYQNFSYSLKSRIPLETWNDPISSLGHISGFAKFSDLVIESGEDTDGAVMLPDDSNIESLIDITGHGNLNAFYNFDYVSEETLKIDDNLISKDIVFKNRDLMDYWESIGNRVLKIDDFSGSFNSNPRQTKYSKVSSFNSNRTYNRVLTLVKDVKYIDEVQFSIVSMIQNNNTAYSNEYAILDSYLQLGYHDYLVTSGGWDLVFYPNKFKYNSYQMSALNLSIIDDDTLCNPCSSPINFGDCVKLSGSRKNVAAGAGTDTIVSIASTYRSSKVNVQLKDTSNNFSIVELSIVHDGTNVHLLEYGDMSNSDSVGSVGLGTFGASISGGNVNITLSPVNPNVAIDATASIISITNNTKTSVGGTTLYSTGKVFSTLTTIPSSGSPSAIGISTYVSPYQAAYHVISVEDTTNNQYQMSEVAIVNSSSNQGIVEFGNVTTGVGLGTFGVTTASGGKVILTFTPIASANVEVRTYSSELLVYNENSNNNEVISDNITINDGFGNYVGTQLDLKTAFNLRHNDKEIFRRRFNGNDGDVINTTNNTITIDDHFFVSGEKLIYSYSGEGTNNAVGIETTTVTGIGLTDKLPHEVYIVKVDNSNIRFTDTAEKALQLIPDVFEFSSVGIGTSHSINATNTNTKSLITIDNIIQSPITNTTISSELDQLIAYDTIIPLTGVTSIFAGDLLQIEDEIITVHEVGISGNPNNLSVLRATMGTTLGFHTAGTAVNKITGNYNIVYNSIHFSDPPYGQVPLSTTTGNPDYRDWTGITTNSTFQGRTFMRTGGLNKTNPTYTGNFIFDDISSEFTGIKSTFSLKSSDSNVVGFSTDNAIILVNNVFQEPYGPQLQSENYRLSETSGITSVTFTGSDSYGGTSQSGEYPSGGRIVSVGSSEGFAYQPLVAAGGTAIVSTSGTITSVSIANTGSGYRSGIQTFVNVGVQTYSDGTPSIEFIGTAAISGGHIVSIAITNPGAGYTSTNPPDVVFDDPFSYTNIPLIYSSSSTQGSGQNATVDIVVGQGSSVIDFEIKNFGESYGNKEILTFAIGGTSGIPTDTTKTFKEFQLNIDKLHVDKFNGWSMGLFQSLDELDSKFNGIDRVFKLTLSGEPFATKARRGSNININNVLLVFINGVLQEPEVAYEFRGGSRITFAEPPDEGDSSKLIFYKGTSGIDVLYKDIIENVHIGDIVDIDNDPNKGQSISWDQSERRVIEVEAVDFVETNPYDSYNNPGVTDDTTIIRPVTWIKQTSDIIINGKKIGKDRINYEPLVYPTSYLIQPVSYASTIVYVDSLVPIFNSQNEFNLQTRDVNYHKSIRIISQDSVVSASATAIVSDTGTIDSFDITNTGIGYSFVPSVIISAGDSKATATASISDESVSQLTITDVGSGYTSTNPPIVLIESPTVKSENIGVNTYYGDYGTLVGYGVSTISGDNKIIFDLFIDIDSQIRDGNYVGFGSTSISGISAGDYFSVYNSSSEFAEGTVISRDDSLSIISVTDKFLDTVYQVNSTYIHDINVIGVGNTTVRRVFCNVGGISTQSYDSSLIKFDSNVETFDIQEYTTYSGGISSSTNFGSFNWGKIVLDTRIKPKSFNFYGNNGYSGISTSALVNRVKPLKFVLETTVDI